MQGILYQLPYLLKWLQNKTYQQQKYLIYSTNWVVEKASKSFLFRKLCKMNQPEMVTFPSTVQNLKRHKYITFTRMSNNSYKVKNIIFVLLISIVFLHYKKITED